MERGCGGRTGVSRATTTEYDWYGNPAKLTDTANASTRTTTTTYDNAGRPGKVTVTGRVGQAVPDATTQYDPDTGRPVKTVSSTAGRSSGRRPQLVGCRYERD